LQTVAGLELALVFGSVAAGRAHADSDIDLAVRYAKPLSAAQNIELIGAVAEVTGRPVDLIDLRTAGPMIARQALTTGTRLYGGASAWTEEIGHMLVEHADFAPLVERVFKERARTWMQR
jgi:predicted nucleotidyltransferase